MKLFVEVHYQVKEGMRDEFLRKIKEGGIAEASRQEPGNGRYDYYLDIEDQNQVLLLELWDTVEDQKTHGTTPHYKILSELKEKYVEKTDVIKTMIE